jgi:hypothetical protein
MLEPKPEVMDDMPQPDSSAPSAVPRQRARKNRLGSISDCAVAPDPHNPRRLEAVSSTACRGSAKWILLAGKITIDYLRGDR